METELDNLFYWQTQLNTYAHPMEELKPMFETHEWADLERQFEGLMIQKIQQKKKEKDNNNICWKAFLGDADAQYEWSKKATINPRAWLIKAAHQDHLFAVLDLSYDDAIWRRRLDDLETNMTGELRCSYAQLLYENGYTHRANRMLCDLMFLGYRKANIAMVKQHGCYLRQVSLAISENYFSDCLLPCLTDSDPTIVKEARELVEIYFPQKVDWDKNGNTSENRNAS